MGNCRPKKEKITKQITHWYPICPTPTAPPLYTKVGPVEFDYKVWHECGGQNDSTKLVGNGEKLPKLYRTRLYSPRGTEDTDGNIEYNWEYVYQQKYESKLMDANDLSDKELAQLEDQENEYNIFGYDTEGFFENGDPIYYNKPIFKRQCRANTVYDEQYFYNIFYWPDDVSINRKVGGLTKYQPPTPAAPPGGGAAVPPCPVYGTLNSTVTATLTIQGVQSVIENAPEGLIYYHGGTFDNKIFFTYEPDANSDGTLDVIAEGDTVNGWTVDKVINYITDKSLRRRVSKNSGRNKTPSYVVVNDLVVTKGKVNSVSQLPSAYEGSIDDYYIVDDNEDTLNQLYYQWNGTAWVGPVNVTGILVGDKVKANGISKDAVVTEIRGRKIFLSKPIKTRKIRKATFVSEVVNRVNASTLCYAEISGGSADFTRNGSYTTGAGRKIVVKAGKGIKTRSAVVGVYAARSKRYIEYNPIFYTKDNDCEKVVTEDQYAKYTVGDIILADESLYVNDQELVIEPKTQMAYTISNVYWSNFGIPPTKAELTKWITKYPNDTLYLQMEGEIKEEVSTLLNNRLVSRIIDTTCNDPIYQSIDKIYFPYQELDELQNSFSPIQETAFDPCIDVANLSAYTAEELQEYINTNLTNAFSTAGMVLPQEMYNQVIQNEDSMMNRYTQALNTVQESVSKIQQMPNLPPMLEGENESPIDLTIETIRRMPPKFGNVEFLINDVIFDGDNSLNPDSVENNPMMIIKSIPAFTGTPSVGNNFTLSTTTKTVGTITNAIDTIELTAAAPLPETPDPLFPTIPGPAKEWLAPGPAGNDDWEDDVDNKQFIKHKTTNGARPYPRYIWKEGLSYQSTFTKIANFRVNEISSVVSEALANKGNPYQDDPVYAELLEDVTGTSTSIKIKGDTSRFLSSGYLLLPKYMLKTEESDLQNATKHYFYLGEEIIYYGSKTSNTFQNCIRGAFGTTPTFEVIVNAIDIEAGYLYTIASLGNTNWADLGAPENYTVGTTFKSVKDGVDSTGTAYVFGSTTKPFDNAPAVNTVFNSYQKRNYIVQFWPYKLRTDTSSI